ncbi:hypothetical protein [Sphingomonas crocodyli]|nr:hypothetical protein [Sphingomonas crocodyli]
MKLLCVLGFHRWGMILASIGQTSEIHRCDRCRTLQLREVAR